MKLTGNAESQFNPFSKENFKWEDELPGFRGYNFSPQTFSFSKLEEAPQANHWKKRLVTLFSNFLACLKLMALRVCVAVENLFQKMHRKHL